jgi:hypothetical protein
VAKRSGIPTAVLPATFNNTLAIAVPIAPIKITRVDDTISERFSKLEINAPNTKPSWTAMVSHPAVLGESFHSARSWGMIAEAENHVDIDSTRTAASNARATRRLGVSFSAAFQFTVLLLDGELSSSTDN